MRVKNTCGDERGFGRLVIGPDETHDIDDPVVAQWFLRHGCVDADVARKPEIENIREPGVSVSDDDDMIADTPSIRDRAKAAGLRHHWSKSISRLVKELKELKEG